MYGIKDCGSFRMDECADGAPVIPVFFHHSFEAPRSEPPGNLRSVRKKAFTFARWQRGKQRVMRSRFGSNGKTHLRCHGFD
jgi:hypothetical protein